MKLTIDKISEILDERNIDVNVLYCTQYGSKLYGTDNESSDDDYKVIFLPSLNDLILTQAPKAFSISTGTDDKKNTAEDIDIEFYSIQYWMNNLKRGETGALDILFSIFRDDTQVYANKIFKDTVKRDYKNYFTATEANSYLGYALAQANTYCIKGKRLNVLKDITEYLKNNISEVDFGKRLREILPQIESFLNSEYCKIEDDSVTILGKKHFLEIYVSEFIARINDLYGRYGHRAHKAATNGGFDFKAVSHALRTCIEFEELISNEIISFPLKDAELIKEIKYGKIDKEECTKIVLEKIEATAELLKKVKGSNTSHIKYDRDIANELILMFY